MSAALSLAVSGTIWGQSKISADGLSALENYRFEQSQLKQSMSSTPAEIPTVGVIARIAPGYTADYFADMGYEITCETGSTVVIEMPITDVEAFSQLDAVKSLTFGGKKEVKLDFARKSGFVNEAHKGIKIGDVTRSFTGQGVILGMMDTGLQANHVNFIADNGEGASRIQRLYHFRTSYGAPISYNNTTVKRFTTDTNNETHGTHVAGIMGGSYRGLSDMAYSPTATSLVQKRDAPMEYYGVAPDADLALAVGELYDSNILTGVQRIADYAKSLGKPVAINLSLGANIGPHDGTDEFTSALNDIGKDAIICISSGNEGDLDMSIEKTFTEDDTVLKSFLEPSKAYGASSISGILDVWASDNRPFEISIIGYRIADGNENPYAVVSSAGTRTISSGTGLSSGIATLVTSVDANSGRYYARLSPSSYTPLTMMSSYRFELKITGQPGQKINVYYGGKGDFKSYNVAGFTKGSASQSINGNACAKNLISVGSYVTRQYFGILSTSTGVYSMAGEYPGRISSFSSYGTMPDGTPMPQVLAPGSTIISSFNRYFVEGTAGQMYGMGPSEMTGRATSPVDNKMDYWSASDGTSMSCPFVTGVIGLWLEADPTLTVGDIKEILAATSTIDTYTRQKPAAAGYGKINAAKGLEYILTRNASIGSIKDDDASRLLINPSADGYDVVLSGEARFTVSLYDMQGRLAAEAQGLEGTAAVSTAGLPAGIYLLNVQGESTRLTRKVTVR